MPIEYANRTNGFILWPDAGYAPSLGIESDQLQACVQEVKRLGLKGVFGTQPYFRESSLDFLSELPELESVQFWDVKVSKVSALYELAGLRFLRLTDRRPALDFGRLRSLEGLVWSHVPRDTGSGDLHKLQELYLWHYKPTLGNFHALALPSSLRNLGIYWSNATTLEGLPTLPTLTRLEVARCRNLESLGELAQACPNLESLTIQASGRLSADEAMRVASDMPRLRHLFADNKLLVDPNAA